MDRSWPKSSSLWPVVENLNLCLYSKWFKGEIGVEMVCVCTVQEGEGDEGQVGKNIRKIHLIFPPSCRIC